MNPAVRRTGLVERELPGELIVYDLERHQAHCLNRTAAAVFRGADGTRTLAELGALLGDGLDRGEREAAVRMALDQLAGAQLLEAGAAAPDAATSRRSVLRHAGLGAALLLPAIASVVAPTPAEAAATCIVDCTDKLPGTPCNYPATPDDPPPCNSVCDGSGTCI